MGWDGMGWDGKKKVSERRPERKVSVELKTR
jgi:hypothetical protein